MVVALVVGATITWICLFSTIWGVSATKAAEKNTGTSAFFINFLWELFNVADEADGAHAAILT